jgi:hypothetical protein
MLPFDPVGSTDLLTDTIAEAEQIGVVILTTLDGEEVYLKTGNIGIWMCTDDFERLPFRLLAFLPLKFKLTPPKGGDIRLSSWE